ncbi:MAG: hypothetical protein Q9187_004477, partial [Circinaria calcarea]
VICPSEGRLWGEEEDEREDSTAKDCDEVKGPLPPESMGDFPNNDWSKERSTKEGHIRDCHALATLLF